MKNKTFVDKVYKLTRNAAPLSFMLPTRHSRRFPLLYFDESQGTNRTLRYARNQKSPFEDEQDGNVVMEPVIFEDGFLRVPKNNPVLQEFLHYHPLNGKKFIEVNEEKDAAEEVNQFNIEVDALIEARKLTISQVENIGRVLLGIDTSRVTTSELRRDILIYVKRDPSGFMKMVNDPMLKLQSKVKLFFDKSLLSFRNKRKEVWFNTTNNKKKMLTVPYGEDPLYIVSSYLQSDDGLEHLKMLEAVLENDY
tara:strand:- start:2267 stop:3019 length:753 start_codon:yes stop_codon:yes gene_type:complete